MMRRKKNFILTCLMVILMIPTNAQAKKPYDWTKIIDAIIQVESKGDPKAYNPNGDCVGVLQITPILVKECNQILERRKSNKHYTLNDRYNVKKSKEMFVLIQETHNSEHNVEKAIKCWNCGGFYMKNNGWKNYSVEYYKKVMKYYNGGK